MRMGRPPIDMRLRFWAKVNKTGGGCWLWMGMPDDKGYGHLRVEGKKTLAHRISWKLHNGCIPAELFVLHSCDNPSCVNPAHLFTGTQVDNMKDMAQKGRGRGAMGDRNGMRLYPENVLRGEANPRSKLSEETVRQIFRSVRSGATYRHVAQGAGVSCGTVSDIINGRAWKHLNLLAT
jgi:hypothetical protein